MNYFEYKHDQLYAEDIPIGELARRFGTPFYVYSARTLKRHFACSMRLLPAPTI